MRSLLLVVFSLLQLWSAAADCEAGDLACDTPFLLFTDRYSIRLVRLDRKEDENKTHLADDNVGESLPLFSYLKNTVALDYFFDHSDDSLLLFWADISTDQVTSARLKHGVLGDIEAIVTYGVWTPEGLAVDWMSMSVYWVDSMLKQIQVTKFDGSMTATVVNGGMQNPRALAVDPTEGLLFWTLWDEGNPRIERATMAGEDRRVLLSIHTEDPGGRVAERPHLRFLRESDSTGSMRSRIRFHSVRYDGGDRQLVLRNSPGNELAHPFAITAFEEHVFWTDWRSRSLYKAGEQIQRFEHRAINQTLLLATSNAITAVDSDYPNRVVFPLLSTGPASNITAIGDAPNCFGIAVDEAEGNVYFSTWDWAAAKIRVVSNGGVVRTLLTSETFPQLKKPKDLVYKDGRLYWLDRGLAPQHPRLLQCGADGRKPSELKISEPSALQDAHSLTAYGNDLLLWSASNVTHSLNLTSMKLESVQMRTTTNSSVDLVVADNRVKEFLLYDRQNASVTGRLLIAGHLSNMSRPLRDDVRGLVSMKLMLRDPRARELETETRALCLKLNCDHFCLRVSDSRRCFCADSFIENGNGQCELPKDRLLMLSSLGDLHWIVKPTNRSAELSAVQLSSEWNNQPQPRYFALGNGKTKTSSKLMDGGVFSLTSVAVDGRSGYVYVGTFRKKQALYPTARGMIVVLNPEFADLRKTIVTTNDTVESLRVDAKNGYLFWKSTFALRRSRLDGSDVVRFPLKRSISDLAVDPRTRRLLLLPFGGSISILDYDFRELAARWAGMQNRTESGLVSYDSIAVGPHANTSDSFLYFATRQQLWKVPLKEDVNSTTAEQKELVARLPTAAISIQVDEPDAAKAVSVCATADCEQFCFEVDAHAKCECAYSQLGADGRSCHRFSSFVAYVHGASIEFAPTIDGEEHSKLSTNGELNRKEAEVLQSIRNSSLFRAPVALAADEERRLLFVSDVQMDRIVAVALNQTTSLVVVDGVKKVEGLAYDGRHQTLYFAALGGLFKADVKTIGGPKRPEVVLPLEREDAVRGLAVNPCTSTLVFANWRRDAPKIERLEMESGKRDVLVETDIRTPNTVAFDFTSRKIYWADAAGKIERMEEDGSAREVVWDFEKSNETAFIGHIFGLAVYEDHLFFTDWSSVAVHSMDKQSGEMATIRGHLLDHPMGIAIFAEDSVKCGEDECTRRAAQLNCTETCRMDPAGRAFCVEKTPTCTKECLNEGTCQLQNGTSDQFECTCPIGFMGDRCEVDKCVRGCKHGTCTIDHYTELPICDCEFGWMGAKCDQKSEQCKGFCKNGGVCHSASNGVHCECLPGFSGLRCGNCRSRDGHELVCTNGGFCNADRSTCTCPAGYSGLECEVDECSEIRCLNGGQCDRNATFGAVSCRCPPFYAGKHCELDFCRQHPDFCLHGGVCAHLEASGSNDGDAHHRCLCGTRFKGERCETAVSCEEHCGQGAKCTIDAHSNDWRCTCPEGRTGDRCEHSTRCEGGCIGGRCVSNTNGTSECRCPPGIGLVTDEHGNRSCTRYTATSCKELECAHGHCYGSIKAKITYECVCFNGFAGLLCDQPDCSHFCADGAECRVAGGFPYCVCAEGQYGPRCDQRLDGTTEKRSKALSARRVLLVWIPFAFAFFVLVFIAYLRAVKRQQHAEGHKQFQHERMLEEEPPNDEVGEFQCHNPAFLADDEEPHGHEPDKDDPTRVYNETILSNNSDGPLSASSSFAGLPERFNLLRSTIEFR
ncbi:hypothetical protein M3Y99_01967800 [Aphelenchoides fujianensis]|nr:hypothetical protein M3Y99_01967800 [Aphelenchoides fujianensis]